MTDIPRTKKNLPRHSAGSMELKEGTGPITTMCACGPFLEIYKQDKTFRVQTPETIDPDETNPHAPWVASPIADVGSSNLVVARVLLQSKAMLDAAFIDGPLDKEAIVAHLHACKETILSGEKIATKIAANIGQIIRQINQQGITKDKQGRGLNPFPQVTDLDLDCGSFLVQVNRALKLISEMPSLFLELGRPDSNFDHLAKHLAEVIGDSSPITTFVLDNASAVRYLIDLRNFHEHPRKIRTVIKNFSVLPDGQIQAPVWYLQGDGQIDPHSIGDEALATLDFIRELAEVMFIHLLMHRISKKFPFFIEQIPEDKLAPQLPIRYKLSIDIGMIHAAK